MRRYGVLSLIALLFGALIVAAPAFAQRDSYGDRMTHTGTVTDTDSRRTELTVRFDDFGTRRVNADEANVSFDGRSGRFDDIRDGDRVSVYGTYRSDYVDAYTIRVLDRDSDRYGDRDTGRITTVSGRVRSTDTRRSRFEVDSTRGRILVTVGRQTDIREDGRRRSIGDIHTGDYVTVTGRIDSRDQIGANTVDLGTDSGYNRDRRGMSTIVTGEVSRATSTFDRDLTVRTPLGDTVISVPRSASVTRGGRSISVHDIRRGDRIRAFGTWEGNTFSPSRVEVITGWGSRDEDSFFGTIDRINDSSREFRLRTDRGNYTVIAHNADILDRDGRSISFRDLNNGQSVWVYGELRGLSIRAERVERGELYSNRGSRGSIYRP